MVHHEAVLFLWQKERHARGAPGHPGVKRRPVRERAPPLTRPALSVVTCLVVSSCQCACPQCPDDSEDGTTPTAPEASTVEIVPDSVHVRAGETFTLLAVPRTATGGPISEAWGLSLDWEVLPSDHLTITDETGHRVTLQADPALPIAPPSTTVGVTVSLPGGVDGKARVVLLAVNPVGEVPIASNTMGGGGIQSWVRAKHQPKTSPEVVLIRGASPVAGECIAFAPLAFVGAGRLGDIRGQTACPFDRGVVFSSTLESPLRDVPWGTDQEVLNFDVPPNKAGPINETLDVPIEVEVSIWLGTSMPDLANRAMDQLDLANAIFEANRVGIRFKPRTIGGVSAPIDIRDLDVPGSEFDRCKQAVLDGHFTDTAEGPGANAGYKMDLNIFYVVLPSNVRAEACPPTAPTDAPNVTYGRMIFVNAGHEAYTSLAHELGHVLSLRWPLHGHTHELAETIDGFNSSNLMWSTSDDDAAEARLHLSLGQAFRMNVDKESWLNVGTRDPAVAGSPRIRDATEPTEDCMCQDPHDDSAEPCPRLTADIRNVPPGTGTFAGTCPP